MSWRLEERDLTGRWGFSREELSNLDQLLESNPCQADASQLQMLVSEAAQQWLNMGGAQRRAELSPKVKRMSLTTRLKIVAAHHPEGWGFVDLGTDHAALPIELCRHQISSVAAGVDIARPPLMSAFSRLTRSGQVGRVSLILGDGVKPLLSLPRPEEVISPWDEEGSRRWIELRDREHVTVSICGVGGEVASAMIHDLPPWVSVILVQANDQTHRVDEALMCRQAKQPQPLIEVIDEAVVERERLFVTKIYRPLRKETTRYTAHHKALWDWVRLSRSLRRLVKTPLGHASRVDKSQLVSDALAPWIL